MKTMGSCLLVTVVTALLLTISITSCTSNSAKSSTSSPTPPTNAAISYFGTQSPGDSWSWTITKNSAGSGTFSAVNNTSGKTYSGNVVTLSNKFLELTITTTTDSNVTVGGASATAYALEFPNTAVIVKPAGFNDLPVIGAAQGTCPSPANYNWIKVPTGSWDVTTDPAFGTAVTSGSASSLTLAVAPYLLGGSALSAVTYTGSCSQGLITASANAKFGLTPSGVFIGDQGTDGGVVGMLQPAAKIGSTAILQQGREFRGFVFMTHPPNGPNNLPVDKTQAIWSRTLGDNLITAAEYTTFDTGVEDTCPGGDSCATLSLDSEVAPGEFAGTMIDSHAGSHPFSLMINQINGKYMIFGFSREQAGLDPTALFPYIFLVMEQ